MLEQRKNSEQLAKTVEESSKFSEDALHDISSITLDLAQLTVPCRSGMVIGKEAAPDRNMELLDGHSARLIERMCTKLSDSRLSPMERDQLADGLLTELIRQVSRLESQRPAIDSPISRSALDDAIATLGHLAHAVHINEMKLRHANPSPALFREPYELGGTFLHVNRVIHSLPSEPRAITEALFTSNGQTKESVAEGFKALRDVMEDCKLSDEKRGQVLKCLALAGKSVEVRDFAIKEYLGTLNPAGHDETIQRMLSVGDNGARSLLLPHYLEHLSEEFTKHGGARAGSDVLLPILNRLGQLANQIDKLPEKMSSSVYDALYAIRNEIGVNEKITQVADQLRILVAREKGENSAEFKKYVQDFSPERPTFWGAVKNFLNGNG